MSGRSMCRPPLRRLRGTHRRSAPCHHPYKFDAVAVLKRAARPFIAHQGVVVELDENTLGIKAAAHRKFADRRGGADLPRAAVDEDADGVGHWDQKLPAQKKSV